MTRTGSGCRKACATAAPPAPNRANIPPTGGKTPQFSAQTCTKHTQRGPELPGIRTNHPLKRTTPPCALHTPWGPAQREKTPRECVMTCLHWRILPALSNTQAARRRAFPRARFNRAPLQVWGLTSFTAPRGHRKRPRLGLGASRQGLVTKSSKVGIDFPRWGSVVTNF